MRSFDTPESEENWRGEPETVDVWSQQGEVDWSKQPFSDKMLAHKVRNYLEALLAKAKEAFKSLEGE